MRLGREPPGLYLKLSTFLPLPCATTSPRPPLPDLHIGLVGAKCGLRCDSWHVPAQGLLGVDEDFIKDLVQLFVLWRLLLCSGM